MHYYYTAAINILVQELNLDIHEAIEKLRIPEGIRTEVLKTYKDITKRELYYSNELPEGDEKNGPSSFSRKTV